MAIQWLPAAQEPEQQQLVPPDNQNNLTQRQDTLGLEPKKNTHNLASRTSHCAYVMPPRLSYPPPQPVAAPPRLSRAPFYSFCIFYSRFFT